MATQTIPRGFKFNFEKLNEENQIHCILTNMKKYGYTNSQFFKKGIMRKRKNMDNFYLNIKIIIAQYGLVGQNVPAFATLYGFLKINITELVFKIQNLSSKTHLKYNNKKRKYNEEESNTESDGESEEESEEESDDESEEESDDESEDNDIDIPLSQLDNSQNNSTENNKLQQEINKLQQEINKLKEHKSQTDKELRNYYIEHESFGNQLNEYTKKLKKSEVISNEKHTENINLKNTINILNTEITNLEDRIYRKDKKIKTENEICIQLDNKNRNLKHRNDEYYRKIETFTNDKSKMKQHYENEIKHLTEYKNNIN